MDESMILPSPNWFHSSVLTVSNDNWVIYGGPSRSLCVLEPLPPDSNGMLQRNQGYRAHVHNFAHIDKILCVDICPEWPAKWAILTGSADGMTKQWSLERDQDSLIMKSTHNHEIHKNENEEVAGVGYCNNGYAITVGSHGFIVKWDLNSNVLKSYNQLLKGFRPVCMACSPHVHMNVAIGTKQGVIFVFDLNGRPRTLYKVRGQDDEILKVSWCPQYEVSVKKSMKDWNKRSAATQRMQKIRLEPEHPEVIKELDRRVQDATAHYKKDDTIEYVEVNENIECPKRSDLSEHLITNEVPENATAHYKMDDTIDNVEVIENEESPKRSNLSEHLITKEKPGSSTDNEPLDESGIDKTLPEDSFDESVVVEDDMFDIYKDPEDDEFGHKKYEPEDILVKVPEESKEIDYLAECIKLKQTILTRKNQAEVPIQALVDALEHTHVDNRKDTVCVSKKETQNDVFSVHPQRHMLASISRYGGVRLWSKSGKVVSSCTVANSNSKKERNQRPTPKWTTLLWYKANSLLIADGKGQLLNCNPLNIDSLNKLKVQVLHGQHKRIVFVIASNAPRVQTPTEDTTHDNSWSVWTTSQDRFLIRYSVKNKQIMSKHNTCGGFVYTIEQCPYDAKKTAISVGDGAVRVLEADMLEEDDTKLSPLKVTMYWQNVQGKILTIAWHPSRENWLAFATAECRIGLIDSTKPEKPARALSSGLSGSIYSLAWGPGNELYACGGGEMVMYRADKPDDAPTPILVELEGLTWEPNSVNWTPRGLTCGSLAGGVAVLTPVQPHTVLAAIFVYSKMIHTIDWHPQETSGSSEESPFKNLIAVCSIDKSYNIVILEYGDEEDGTKKLTTWKTLSGHRGSVLKVRWSPHIDGQLVSTSMDGTVRIWNAGEGVCTSIYPGHTKHTLCALFSAFPQLSTKVISGGADCCVQLWDLAQYPAEAYEEAKEEATKKKKTSKKEKRDFDDDEEPEVNLDVEVEKGAVLDNKFKLSRKFLLPVINKQTNPCKINGPRRMLQRYLESSGDSGHQDSAQAIDEYDLDYIKIFGSINELNEVLDVEMEHHEDIGHTEGWMMLSIVRGHIDSVIQRASKRNLLDSFLVSITPSVSFKYWKDVTQMYIAQIDRFAAKGLELKTYEKRTYGGIFRKVASLLSLHDIKGAVTALMDERLFKEAYVLCRARHIDSIAEETLRKWAADCVINACWNLAAVCYIALGDLSQAASVLGKSKDEESLGLAVEIATVIGQTTFADHVEKKREQIITFKGNETEPEQLIELPTRVDLLMDKALAEKHSEETEEVLEELTCKMENLTSTCQEKKELDETEKVLEQLPCKMEKLKEDHVQNGEANKDKEMNHEINGDQEKGNQIVPTNEAYEAKE